MNPSTYFSLNDVQLLAHRLDNPTLEALSHTSVLQSIFNNETSSDWFWYLRTQTLVGRELLWRQGDWKTAYYILENALQESNPYTRDVLSNLIATYVLLELGCDPSVDDNYAIRAAASDGHLEVVKLLLADERVDPTSANNYSVREAAQQGYLEVVGLLLTDKRVSSTVDGNQVIRRAAIRHQEGKWCF